MANWTQNIGNYVSRLWKDMGDGTHAPQVVIGANTASIGKLAANSGVDIGDVDVTSTVHPTGLTVAGNGELAGVTSATQCPTLACKYVLLKARWANTGYVYLGLTGVTKPDGTTDTTTGIQLGAGESALIPVSNLNQLYRICDATGDCLTYIAYV